MLVQWFFLLLVTGGWQGTTPAVTAVGPFGTQEQCEQVRTTVTDVLKKNNIGDINFPCWRSIPEKQ